jgi:hypothetical protein
MQQTQELLMQMSFVLRPDERQLVVVQDPVFEEGPILNSSCGGWATRDHTLEDVCEVLRVQHDVSPLAWTTSTTAIRQWQR